MIVPHPLAKGQQAFNHTNGFVQIRVAQLVGGKRPHQGKKLIDTFPVVRDPELALLEF